MKTPRRKTTRYKTGNRKYTTKRKKGYGVIKRKTKRNKKGSGFFGDVWRGMKTGVRLGTRVTQYMPGMAWTGALGNLIPQDKQLERYTARKFGLR